MSLTLQHMQECLSLPFVNALAGSAGVNLANVRTHDYGVDGTFLPVVVRGKRRVEGNVLPVIARHDCGRLRLGRDVRLLGYFCAIVRCRETSGQFLTRAPQSAATVHADA